MFYFFFLLVTDGPFRSSECIIILLILLQRRRKKAHYFVVCGLSIFGIRLYASLYWLYRATYIRVQRLLFMNILLDSRSNKIN